MLLLLLLLLSSQTHPDEHPTSRKCCVSQPAKAKRPPVEPGIEELQKRIAELEVGRLHVLETPILQYCGRGETTCHGLFHRFGIWSSILQRKNLTASNAIHRQSLNNPISRRD